MEVKKYSEVKMVLDRSNISGSLLIGVLWLMISIIYGILALVLGVAMNIHIVNGIGLVLNIGLIFILYTMCQKEKFVKRLAFLLGVIFSIVAFLVSAFTMTLGVAWVTLWMVSMYVVIALPLLLMGFALVRDMDISYQWLGWFIIILDTIMTWVAVYFWAIFPNTVSIAIGQGILSLIGIGILYFLYNRFCQINAGVFKVTFNRDRLED